MFNFTLSNHQKFILDTLKTPLIVEHLYRYWSSTRIKGLPLCIDTIICRSPKFFFVANGHLEPTCHGYDVRYSSLLGPYLGHLL